MPNRSTALIQSLNTLLTPERLAPYKAAAGDDSEMPNRSTALIQSLNTLLTPERLAPYKAAAGDD
ncbi:hypothetical protein ACH49M_31665, partial [Rhodococcus qingshengii]